MCRWMQSNRDRTEPDWLSCAGGFRETRTELTEPKKGQAHSTYLDFLTFPWSFYFGSPMIGHPNSWKESQLAVLSLMVAATRKIKGNKDKPW